MRVLGRRTKRMLADAASELRIFGFDRADASVEARRAVDFRREFDRTQRLLNEGSPDRLARLLDAFRVSGVASTTRTGVLLLTLHYGHFPLLWLWLKRRAHRGEMPSFSLLYDSRQYQPDVPSGQYARLAAAGLVPAQRGDLDLAELGGPGALRAAEARLAQGDAVLIFPDAVALPPDREDVLVCRVGAVTVGYPSGAARLALAEGLCVQGVVLRPSGEGQEVWWAPARRSPLGRDGVAAALQELFDQTVARDPAAWHAWFSE